MRSIVGFGMIYKSSFRVNFTNGTAIAYNIVCPTTAGGNVNDWLFLTAKNRTKKSVEAYVSYNAQNAYEFVVFDWAQEDPNRWQVIVPYWLLFNYQTTTNINGTTYPIIRLQHRTMLLSGSTWYNVVWLQNNKQTHMIKFIIMSILHLFLNNEEVLTILNGLQLLKRFNQIIVEQIPWVFIIHIR